MAELVVFWACGSVLGYGIFFGDFEGEFSHQIPGGTYRENMAMAIFWGLLFGPLGAIMAFFMSGFCRHGLKFW